MVHINRMARYHRLVRESRLSNIAQPSDLNAVAPFSEKTMNRKTTIAGIIAAIGVLLTLIATYFDADPANNADFNAVLDAIGKLLTAFGVTTGFLAAKDAK